MTSTAPVDRLGLTRADNWLTRYFLAKCAVVFIALTLVKSRTFLPQGRFWAEEGAIFYPGICTASGLEGLGFLFNNHLEFWTNLGIFLATRVPLEQAPAISTFYGLLLQALPLALIVAKRQALGLRCVAVLVLIVVAVGMPQSREVWANTINLHFHFALLAALVLALPAEEAGWARLSYLLLAACGLSGIPANTLAPLFILVALIERNPVRTRQAIVLTAMAGLQIYLLVQSGYEGERDMLPRPDVIVLASLAQSFFTLIWSPISGRLAAEVFKPLTEPAVTVETLTGLVFLAASFWLVVRVFGPMDPFRAADPQRGPRIRLVAAATVLLTASITMAIGDSINMISSYYGGRYFYAPNMLIALLLLSLPGRKRMLRKLAIGALLVFSLAGVPRFYAGPDWHAALTAAAPQIKKTSGPVEIAVWPDWSMTIPQVCL